MDEAFLDAFERKAEEELQDAKIPYYIHIENVYARHRL
jgi:hypothetical protein